MKVLNFSQNPRFSYLHDKYYSSLEGSFKIFTKYGEILPFICPLDGPALNVEIIDFYGEVVYSYQLNAISHKIVSRGTDKFFRFDGGVVQCFDLEPCYIPYRIRIGSWYSEYFFIGGDGMTKFEFSSSSDLFDVPYSTGFKQWFYLPKPMKHFDIETFQSVERTDGGAAQVKYARSYKAYDLVLTSFPAFVKNMFESCRFIDGFTITNQDGEVLKIDQVDSEFQFQRFEESFNVWDLTAKLITDISFASSDCNSSVFAVSQNNASTVTIQPKDCIPLDRFNKLNINC